MFFFPSKKINNATETYSYFGNNITNNSLIEDIEEATKVGLLLQKIRPSNSIDENSIIQIANTVMSMNTLFYDKRFSPLVLNLKNFNDIKFGLKLELYDDCFTLINNTKKLLTLPYNMSSYEIINSFSRGIISLALLTILLQNDFSDFDNGKILCCVNDKRLPEIDRHVVILEIDNLTIYSYIRKCKETENFDHEVDLEQKLYVKSYPNLVLDPSLDVSRSYSLIDFNKKQWMSNKEVTSDDFKPKPKVRQPYRNIVHFTLSKNPVHIEIPENLLDIK